MAKKFYITTAIDYANSPPHLGTAFEKIGADVIARYRRLCGDDVFFVMGNDEHSQNVRKKAEELGMDPKAYCDKMALEFQSTWKAVHVSYDFFIQTTDPRHHEVVRDVAARIFKAKDSEGRPIIFKKPYEGFYCISCEAFYDEKDLANGVCPNHKTKPEWIREENYFFRLTSFSDALKSHFSKHPLFLQPETRKNEILSLLEKGLEDVSISRANKTWGIKLPFDESAVAYVWFDALINYISAVGPIGSDSYKKYWPADLHVIGKDITRFHCLIWPAMLMAAGLPLPKSVWAHGFVSIQGEKMSKSRGNVADPLYLANRFGPEVLRYHLMREVPWYGDGDFSEERLVTRYNADLANDLGNLVSRTVTMVRKFVGEELKKPVKNSLKNELSRIQEIVDAYRKKMDELQIYDALEVVWSLVSGGNLFIDQKKPWTLAKDPANQNLIAEIFYIILERIRWSAISLLPVMPEKMTTVLDLLGAGLTGEKFIFDGLPKVGEIKSFQLKTPQVLFPRI